MHGHVGDGNIHVLAILPGLSSEQREAAAPVVAAINRIVDEETAALGGSISAEHGIGRSNRSRLSAYLAPQERELMAGIKALFDPQGLMNPGALFSLRGAYDQ